MVLLGELDLTNCTESLATVSINNSRALRRSTEKSQDKSFVTQYANRPKRFENLSMYAYFCHLKNSPQETQKRSQQKYMIPNFVGASSTPKYPVTDSYARHTIITYRPWRNYPTNLKWRAEFEHFINEEACPMSCKMGYFRVVKRYIDKMTAYEVKSKQTDHSQNTVDHDDYELMTLLGLHSSNDDSVDTSDFNLMERGKDFEWDALPKVRTPVVNFPNRKI